MTSIEALLNIIDYFKGGDGFSQIFKEETDIIYKDLNKLEKYEMAKKTIEVRKKILKELKELVE